jgi:phage protein D
VPYSASSKFVFSSLQDKYKSFLAPSFEITLGSTTIKSADAKMAVSSLTVDIDAGDAAGGCSFTIEGLYDYEKSEWTQSILKNAVVGKKLVIKLGYVKHEQVFFGFVDAVTVDFSAETAPSVTVNGIDAKGYLMNACDSMTMNEQAPSAVVKKILGDCVSASYAKSQQVGAVPAFVSELVQDAQDDCAFLTTLARYLGYCFFVVDGTVVFDDVLSKTSTLGELKIQGGGLLSFSKSMSLRRQVGKVCVESVNPKDGTAIRGEVSSTSLSGSGKTAAQTASPFGKITEKVRNLLMTTPEECKRYAQALLDAHALEYIAGRGRCVGLPEIIPGRYIKLAGMDNASSDTYYISHVRHELTEEGFYTTFDVKGAKSG